MPTKKFDYVNGTDVENFVQGVAITMDEAKAEVDRVMDIFDPDYATIDELPILGSLFGFDIDTKEDPEYQRKLLKTAIDLIKNKGTLSSFNILFHNLGYDMNLVPLWTADYSEEVAINLPYIQISEMPQLTTGTYDIMVVNPDDQYGTDTQILTITL